MTNNLKEQYHKLLIEEKEFSKFQPCPGCRAYIDFLKKKTTHREDIARERQLQINQLKIEKKEETNG